VRETERSKRGGQSRPSRRGPIEPLVVLVVSVPSGEHSVRIQHPLTFAIRPRERESGNAYFGPFSPLASPAASTQNAAQDVCPLWVKRYENGSVRDFRLCFNRRHTAAPH